MGFWLVIGLLALCAAGKVILYDTLDPDCFWHLRVADHLNQFGIGPIVDDLSYASSKQPWTPYSWLAELGMKAVWDVGGYRAAIAVTAVMQAMIAVLLAMCCLECIGASRSLRYSEEPDFLALDPALRSISETGLRGGKTRLLAVVLAAAIGLFMTLPYLSFRPVTMGFVLLFAIAWLILRDQRLLERSRAIWLVIPLTVVLTNVHLFSLFVPAAVLAMGIGSMIQGRSTVGRSANRYALLLVGVTLACLCTPMLPGMIRTVIFYGSRDRMVTGPVIAEMQSFARGPMGFVSGGLLIGVLGCIARYHRKLPVGQLICVAGATLLLFKLGRFAPLFALAACPALAATLPGLKDRILGKPVVIAALTLVLSIGGWRVFSAFPGRDIAISTWLNRHGPNAPGYPCEAADFIDQSVVRSSGHLINEFSWGGYLTWRLAGRYQVLLDGRTQVYPASLWQAAYLGSAEDRQRFLASVQADAALLPVEKSVFRSALIQQGWTTVYQDGRAQVLVPPRAMARVEP